MVIEGLGNICCWTDERDWVSWDFQARVSGEYVVELRYACEAGSEGTTFEVALGGQRLASRVAAHTVTWYDHEVVELGRLSLPDGGSQRLLLKPLLKPGVAVMNLAWLRLIPNASRAAYAGFAAEERRRSGTDYAGPVFVVPNFHPASCGWLTDFSTERNHCAYSYLAHLDRVSADPNYAFALSEVNNLMAILALEPERFAELKQRVRAGRVELANAFFLEPTINLSGGEALAKMGVEGLRWQEQVMGVRPRVAWMIDVTGVHEQMAQIVSALGLEAMVYTRDNPTGKAVHWMESPDGSRSLAVSPGGYSDWGSVFNSKGPLDAPALEGLVRDVRRRARSTPPGAPVLVLGGAGDYSLPPARTSYPGEFLEQWKAAAPGSELRFSGLGKYLDALLPELKAGRLEMPVSRGGARMSWTSFWIQCPEVKGRYRRAEHALQGAETLAAVASLRSEFRYPAQPLHAAWLQMLLNMDRNTLWGAAAGVVFEHPASWDVRDRFASVMEIAGSAQMSALRALAGQGTDMALFNPLNWTRSDPIRLRLPPGRRFEGLECQWESDGSMICQLELPSCSVSTARVAGGDTIGAQTIPLPPAIETEFYVARLDPTNGALWSLKLKPAGRELLGGPVLLVAEKGGDGHNTPARPQRTRLADARQFPARLMVTDGPVATVVRVESVFYGGGKSIQTLRFYRRSPRIDFEVELNDIPDQTVVLAEFPLADKIKETRRGIPFGFSHGAWAAPNPELAGYADGIQPAIRWSHYQLARGGGVALLDRGLPGRELNGDVPTLFLLNAQDRYMGYPGGWLSGKGSQRGAFALLAHEGVWAEARVQREAWQFNAPPIALEQAGAAATTPFVETSDNLIVEAMRREGGWLELRLVEALGSPGPAWVTVHLPHTAAFSTDLTGARAVALPPGPRYEFSTRPQQIFTLRLATERRVAEVEPLLKWDDLVPTNKLEALRKRLPDRVGHPPLAPVQ
jgi:alpha-mannosidase